MNEEVMNTSISMYRLTFYLHIILLVFEIIYKIVENVSSFEPRSKTSQLRIGPFCQEAFARVGKGALD